jgi:hypothetical protein
MDSTYLVIAARSAADRQRRLVRSNNKVTVPAALQLPGSRDSGLPHMESPTGSEDVAPGARDDPLKDRSALSSRPETLAGDDQR